MGKLNIAHHKSYHPYRRDNIERVRRDEEEAKQKEAIEEGRTMLADSEARMDLLRHRVGASKRGKPRDDDDLAVAQAQAQAEAEPAAGPSSLTSGGHINLFEDLERQAMPVARKPNPSAETEKGIPLAPSEKDLKPWYSDRDPERGSGLNPDRRMRDLARKSVSDPLASINSQLAARPNTNATHVAGGSSMRRPFTTAAAASRERRRDPPASQQPEAARMARESSERTRALELIRRKKREMAGSETPSTVRGGMDERGGGYGDVFNRREVEDAHRYRDRRWDGRAGAPVKVRW